MKAIYIKEYEVGNSCFGDILRINGVDYGDISKEDVLNLLADMFENNYNAEMLKFDVLKSILDYFEYDCVEEDNYVCDQCGSWNNYSRYERDEE